MSLGDFGDRLALLVMFICSHCPHVKHMQGELVRLDVESERSDLGIVAIDSNDPEDGPEHLGHKGAPGLPVPVLFDETQEGARMYTAAGTPDFFPFGAAWRLVYGGSSTARGRGTSPG